MEVLRRKLDNLMRGEEGVALVVTLSLFMFLYVSAAGVFSIGHVIKDRIALQNAVDAAAYSAAVVEADALSKIATVNRAMAYTYYSMVINQMNYIAWKWMYASIKENSPDSPTEFDGEKANYEINREKAKYITDLITLKNGKQPFSKFYSELYGHDLAWAENLKDKIDEERENLSEMGNMIKTLIGELADNQKEVIQNILKANLPDLIGDYCFYNSMIPDYEAVFVETDEDRFLSFLNMDDIKKNGTHVSKDDFEEIGTWFPKFAGIGRRWIAKSGELLTKWSWQGYDDIWHFPDVDANEDLVDEYFEGHEAKPLVLNEKYFNEYAGAVSVAVAMKARNPWEEMFKRVGKSAGLYGVFDPNSDNSSWGSLRVGVDWIYAVSSAQAGFRKFKSANADDPYLLQQDGYEEENLRTDDWDAVFVPVSEVLKGKFGDFMTGSGWELVDKSNAKVASYEVKSSTALPRMHNSEGSLQNLDWAKLLDLIYH